MIDSFTGFAFADRCKISSQFSAVRVDASEFDRFNSFEQPNSTDGGGVPDRKTPSIISVMKTQILLINKKK